MHLYLLHSSDRYRQILISDGVFVPQFIWIIGHSEILKLM